MKQLGQFFLFGAIVELIAGTSLLAFYDNPIGYLGLVASIVMATFVPFLEGK